MKKRIRILRLSLILAVVLGCFIFHCLCCGSHRLRSLRRKVGRFQPVLTSVIGGNGVSLGNYDGTSCEITGSFGGDLPKGCTVKAFCMDDDFAPIFRAGEL